MDYKRGLRLLRPYVPSHMLHEFDLFEHQLLVNLDNMKYGETDTLRIERWKLIYELNRLARTYTDQSFTDLCQVKEVAQGQSAPPEPISTPLTNEIAAPPAFERDVHPMPTPPAVTQTKHIQHRWALLVGIDQYDDTRIQNLKFCTNDVEKLEQLLKQINYKVTSVSSHGDHQPRPTKNTIIHKLSYVCQKAKEDDLLLVYFACHGIIVDGKPLLITQDTYLSDLQPLALAISDVIELMRQKSRARRKILILDACHVGIDLGREVIDPAKFIDNVYEQAEGFAIIAASTAQQRAYEWNNKQHGVFTYFLLKGLAGEADLYQPGFITVSSLFAYIVNGVSDAHDEIGGLPQSPSLTSEATGDIPLAYYPPRSTEPPSLAAHSDNGGSSRATLKPDEPRVQHRALVIGCNDFPHLQQYHRECQEAALQVRAALTPRIPLIQSLTDSQATHQKIGAAFNDLSSNIDYQSVFIFWSGRVFAGNPYFLHSYDTKPGNQDAISFEELWSWLKNILRAGRSIFACLDLRNLSNNDIQLGKHAALITWRPGTIPNGSHLGTILSQAIHSFQPDETISARQLCLAVRQIDSRMRGKNGLEIREPDISNDFIVMNQRRLE